MTRLCSPASIEIIGGGLAGLSLGLALRRENIPVILHEAGDYPRHRVCGEFIAGLGHATIARLGLATQLSDALEHHEVAWFMAGEPPRIHRLPSPALALSRHVLDARLASAFVAAGGVLHTHSRITNATNSPGRVFANGRRRAPHSRWLGLKLHARNLPLARGLEVHLGAECYVGLAQVGGGAVNVCGLFRRGTPGLHGTGLLLGYLRASGLAQLADRLAAADTDTDSFCAVAALGFDPRFPPGADVRLGDAGAMIPPFTGNGMAMAFQSAELALAPLLAFARGETGWPATCRATNAALRGRFRLRLASARAVHPFILQPQRQRWLAIASRAHLLPFSPLYATLH